MNHRDRPAPHQGLSRGAAVCVRGGGRNGAELAGSHAGLTPGERSSAFGVRLVCGAGTARTAAAIPARHVPQVRRPPSGAGSPAGPVAQTAARHEAGTAGFEAPLESRHRSGRPTDARGPAGPSQRSVPAIKRPLSRTRRFPGTPFLGDPSRRRGSPVCLPLPPLPPARTSRRSPARCTTTARFCPGAAMARLYSRVQGPTAKPPPAAGPPSAPGRPGAAPQAPLPLAPQRPGPPPDSPAPASRCPRSRGRPAGDCGPRPRSSLSAT